MINFEKLYQEIENVEYAPEQLLEFGKLGKTFKKRPSEYLKIDDAEKALAFDMTCTRELIKYEAEKDKESAQLQGYELGKVFREQTFTDVDNQDDLIQ